MTRGRPPKTEDQRQEDKAAGVALGMAIEAQQWTRAHAAERIGVTPQTLARWVSGESRPREQHLATLRRLGLLA